LELDDLLEQSGSLDGAALDQRVEAVDSGLDNAMQRADVTHNEVQWALQRHPGCMWSLSETVRKVVGAMRHIPTVGRAMGQGVCGSCGGCSGSSTGADEEAAR
jgi:hypothetical protein